MRYETIDDLPVLHTARLTLAIAGPQDAELIARFHGDNAEFLAPWEPLVPSTSADAEAQRRARELAVASARAGNAYQFALSLASSQPHTPIVGFLNFTNIVRGVFQACYMGYKLDRQMEGLGYMTEAAQAGIEFCFEVLRLHRVMANYMPHNQRSAALLRRLGFAIEGVARDYLFIGGEWRDHVLTSLVNPEPMTCS